MKKNFNLPSVVILAGGYAERLYPKTKKIPKSLININKKPFIYHQLKLLEKKNFTNVIICLGHKSKMIKNYIKKNNVFNLNIFFSNEKKKLGTGGAIKNALNLLDKEFFVIFGDSYLNVNYNTIYKNFIISKKDLVVSKKFNKKYKKYSIEPEFEIKKKGVINYRNKQRFKFMNHIYYGIGIFKKSSFLKINKLKFDLDFFFNKMILSNNLVSYEVNNKFYEIGSKVGLNETKLFFKKKNIK